MKQIFCFSVCRVVNTHIDFRTFQGLQNMAFLRKHRERYWLVHNFRAGSVVRQVRIYAFDLTCNTDEEMARAQHAVDILYPGQIAPTWIETVRQQLQELHTVAQTTLWGQQTAQITQQMQQLVAMLDTFDGPAATKNALLRACLAEVQQRLAPPAAAPALLPRLRAASSAPLPALVRVPSGTALPSAHTLGQGFALAGHVIVHACAHAALPAASLPAEPSQAQAPVVLVTLMSGRNLWLECQRCHTRWTDLACLEPLEALTLHRQKITKFDRFCREHQCGDACAILVQYPSKRIERLHGTIVAIDYATRKIHVSVRRGETEQTYWRLCDHVYFGELEVQLTEAQRRQLETAGHQGLRPLGRTWYAMHDTPEARRFLQQQGIRY